jgi:hypothetical protein
MLSILDKAKRLEVGKESYRDFLSLGVGKADEARE